MKKAPWWPHLLLLLARGGVVLVVSAAAGSVVVGPLGPLPPVVAQTPTPQEGKAGADVNAADANRQHDGEPLTPPAVPADVRRSPAPRLQPPHSLSTSRQFVVYAERGSLRAAVGLLGEEVRAGLRQLLGPAATDGWKIPIVVDLRPPSPGLSFFDAASPSRLTLAQTGQGLKIQLELLLGEAGQDVRPRAELARALLLEIAYRDAPTLPAGRAYRLPPAWLVEGIAALLDADADDTGALADGLCDLLGAPRATLPLCDFLARGPAGLDGPSRQLYRAYAYGLLRLVTEELPGGQATLLKTLRALPDDPPGGLADPGDPAPLLARLLPGGTGHDGAALERWWTAGRARLAGTRLALAVLSIEETERQLADLLLVTLPGGDYLLPTTPSPPIPPIAGRVLPLEEFVRLVTTTVGGRRNASPLSRDVRHAALAPVRTGLLALLGRAHPFYRPIVAGYEGMVQILSRDGTKGRVQWRRVGERLHALAAERAQVRTRAEAIADYLNWFEATQPSQPSGAFEGYFRAARQDAVEERRFARRRTDPISTYLDAVEAEF